LGDFAADGKGRIIGRSLPLATSWLCVNRFAALRRCGVAALRRCGVAALRRCGMLAGPTSKDIGAGYVVHEERIGATLMVVEFPKLFRTGERLG
jgi:hypothetical protein